MKKLCTFFSRAIPAVCLFSILASSALAEGPEWHTNFQKAQSKAKADKKYLLVAFTGSDWCGWCQKLKAEVFDKKPFTVQAAKRFVLVDIDFPHEKKLADELKKQNGALAGKYGVNGFPTVLILKPDGEVIAHTGYRAGGAEGYTKMLADFLTTWDGVVGLRKQLPDAQGIARAKILDQLIEDYGKLNNEVKEIAGLRKEIVSLDPDNHAGLRHKYEFKIFLADAQKALASHKPAVAETAIDKALALADLKPLQIQKATVMKSNCYAAEKKLQASIDLLEKAIKAAPKSPDVAEIKDLLKKRRKLLDEEKAGKSDKAVTQAK